jgi:hypothetical protein
MTPAPEPDQSPDDTGSKQAATRFKPGQSGNPNGRPRGARNRLAGELLEALADDFRQHGIAAIQKVRETDATAYLRITTGLLPKEVVVAALHFGSKSTLDELTEARDFAAAYRLARSMIGAEPPMIEVESERRDAEFDGDE